MRCRQPVCYTPCSAPALKRAFLFSCLTALRKSDIKKLTWEEIQPYGSDGRTALAEINGTEAMNELRSSGLLTLDINGNKVELSEEDLLIETAQTEGYVTEADGDISVVLDTNLTPELIEEGFVREIVSKVQTMRKEAGFEVMDKIHIYAKDNDKILELMKNHKEEIMSEVLAEEMTLGTTDGYVKEWNINKEPVVLGVAKM